METAPFDLNQSVAAWRRRMQDASLDNTEILNELEAHLRDSVTSLQSKGLNTEESFLIATHRMGGHERLATELSKVHPGEKFKSRIAWMLLGMLGIHLVSDLWLAGSALWVLVGNHWGIGGQRLGWFAVVINSLVLIGLIAGIAWRAKVRSFPGLSLWNTQVEHRTKLVLALVGFAFAAKFLANATPFWTARVLTPSAYFILGWEVKVFVTLVWLAAILFLARTAQKLGRQNGLGSEVGEKLSLVRTED